MLYFHMSHELFHKISMIEQEKQVMHSYIMITTRNSEVITLYIP